MSTDNQDVQSLNHFYLKLLAASDTDRAELAKHLGTQEEILDFLGTVHGSWIKQISETVYAWFDLQMDDKNLWSDLYLGRFPDNANPYDEHTARRFSEFLMLALPLVRSILANQPNKSRLLFSACDHAVNVLGQLSPEQLMDIAQNFPALVKLRLGDTVIWSDLKDGATAVSKPRIKNSLNHALTLLLNE